MSLCRDDLSRGNHITKELLAYRGPDLNEMQQSLTCPKEFCKAVLLALDIVELRYPHGVLITTSGITKFYSNGLDLEHASWTPGFFTDSLYALWRRLLVYVHPHFRQSLHTHMDDVIYH